MIVALFVSVTKIKMCETTLIIGSSLGKQLASACKMDHIDNLLFQGKIPLNFIKTELDKRNKSYRVIYVLCGNDLLPTYIVRKQNKKKIITYFDYDFKKCVSVYQGLTTLLENVAGRIVFVQPPPREGILEGRTLSPLAAANLCSSRFRSVINALSSNKQIGVFSNHVLLRFVEENSNHCSITKDDGIHYSVNAIKVIREQVILKNT